MSKVKECYDRKEKARHRLRRYETRHKKLDRAAKYNNNEYMFCKGYWVDNSRRHYKYERVFVPAHDEIEDVWSINEQKVIKKTFHYKDHIIKRTMETLEQPIFIVKQISTDMKYYKKVASRQFRRNKKFDEENYEILKGATYKKYNEVLWNLW